MPNYTRPSWPRKKPAIAQLRWQVRVRRAMREHRFGELGLTIGAIGLVGSALGLPSSVSGPLATIALLVLALTYYFSRR